MFIYRYIRYPLRLIHSYLSHSCPIWTVHLRWKKYRVSKQYRIVEYFGSLQSRTEKIVSTVGSSFTRFDSFIYTHQSKTDPTSLDSDSLQSIFTFRPRSKMFSTTIIQKGLSITIVTCPSSLRWMIPVSDWIVFHFTLHIWYEMDPIFYPMIFDTVGPLFVKRGERKEP